jgi:hypothetical protein
MVNVSEEDYFWFKQLKDQSGESSKEFFSRMRDIYTDSYDNEQLTGT